LLCAVAVPALALNWQSGAQTITSDLDPAFGDGGKVHTDFFGDVDRATAMALQGDGKIIVVGPAEQPNSSGLVLAMARYNSDGSLDASFGRGGKVTGRRGEILPGEVAGTGAIQLQPDGKILVPGGNAGVGGVLRFDHDGGLDTTFGDAGFAAMNIGTYALTLQPDGKILLAGSVSSDGFQTTDIALARLNSDGSPDTTFGQGGRVTANFFGQHNWAPALALQSDGKIALAINGYNISFRTRDFGVARYNSDGSLDTSFGVGGKVTTDFFGEPDGVADLFVQPDGKIVAGGFTVAGTHFYGFGLVRYNPDGSLDPGFGNGGKATVNNSCELRAMSRQPDGKIIAVGGTTAGNTEDFALARFNADGSLDTGFGNHGTLNTDLFGQGDIASDVILQPDGQILVCGTTYLPDPSLSSLTDFALVRYFSKHKVGGRVSVGGTGLGGVTVTVSGTASGSTVTGADGSYSLSLPAHGDYSLAATKANYTFSPPSRTITDLNAEQTDLDFTGQVNLYTISGLIRDGSTGLAGVTVTLGGTQAAATATDGDGRFAFTGLTAGGTYTVTPAQSNYTFTPQRLVFTDLSGDQAAANFTAAPLSALVSFSRSAVTADEAATAAQLTVTRAGNLGSTVTVAYRTVDNPAAVPCDPRLTTERGVAYARCDYATTIDTLTFAPAETTKTILVPLLDDAHVEGPETFDVVLEGPGPGATLGTPARATVTIQDNDTGGGAPNPLSANPFFVRVQYLDFLNREPEPVGLNSWLNVLNNCPDVNNSPGCDRVTVSTSFFGSQEFQLKGFYVFLFYRAAFGRLPQYAEIIPDMRGVAGQTPEEVYQKRAAFAAGFTRRPEFAALYDRLSDANYVSALLNRYGLSSITTTDPAQPDTGATVVLTLTELHSRLAAGTLDRAQVLRAVVQSQEVTQAEFNRAFVAMQYYGYLRRTPEEAGYQNWLSYLTSHPGDFRTMVNGFVNSTEYRLRFGPAQ
jgi:uncharacterized delta-60 repeat protein